MSEKLSMSEALAAWQPIQQGLSPVAQQGMMVTFMAWRGISPGQRVCTSCNGTGTIMYGNTSTWRNAVGGCAMTQDVCANCWGSGTPDNPGADLRKMEKQLEELRAYKRKHEKTAP